MTGRDKSNDLSSDDGTESQSMEDRLNGADGDNSARLRLGPRQDEIRVALGRISPEAEELYLGALHMVEVEPPGASYLLAHAAREIEGSLRDALVERELEAREAECDDAERVKPTHREQIAQALGISKDDPVVKHWHDMAKQFPGRAHRDSSSGVPRDLDEVLPLWRGFENILYALLGSFYEVFSELDRLLSIEHPGDDDIEKLKTFLTRRGEERRRYFFSNLEQPGWVEPLDKAGFFSCPAEMIRNEEDGAISFPVWPESRYLVRMAEHVPEEVKGILLRILSRCKTDNARFLEDCLEAATAMPGNLAAEIAERAMKWDGEYYLLLPYNWARLVRHLADAGEVDTALDLARRALRLTKQEEGVERGPNGTVGVKARPIPTGMLSLAGYEEILSNGVVPIASNSGVASLSLVCDLLEQALRIEGREEGGADYSYIWRPAIEEHEQNTGYGVKPSLVAAARDVAEKIIAEHPKRAKEVYDELERREFPVFCRILLYVLSLDSSLDRDRVVAYLTDLEVLADGSLRHEVYLLAQSAFGELGEAERENVFEWIEKGPDDSEFAIAPDGSERTQGEIERAKNYWRRDKLVLMQGQLSPEWQKRYEALVEDIGERGHPEFLSYKESHVGVKSPMSVEEMGELTAEEIAAYLRRWKPDTDEVFGPAPEGLGNVLEQVVEEGPDRYANKAERFIGVAPTYVRHLLRAFTEAAKTKTALEWEPVLRLCRWVVEEAEAPKQVDSDDGFYEADRGWQWTRQQIAHLLQEGLQRDQIPFELRAEIWEILEALSEDPNPSQDHERRYGGGPMGPAGLSINTVRGEAMHGVVQYALWCARQWQSEGNREQREWLTRLPEVRRVLEWHLDPTNDPSLAIRSVYGQHLPRLVALSSDWIEERLEAIFPREPEDRELRDAAWETYLIFAKPYRDVFELVISEYERAVDEIGTESEHDWTGSDPRKNLAKHIVSFYWGGVIDREDELLEGLFDRADPELRRSTLEFVGRVLRESEDSFSEEGIARLCSLLEWRISACRNADSPEDRSELTGFSWWFESKRCRDKWLLSKLAEVLELTDGKLDAEWLVVERLAELARIYPQEVIECLEKMIESDDKGWPLLGWKESLEKILSATLDSESECAREIAKRVINELGERGHHQYRDLLDP